MTPTQQTELLRIAKDLHELGVVGYARSIKALAATASIAPALPEGFVLAPKKPTEQMMLAAVERAPCIIREYYARDGKYTGTVTSLNNEMFGEAYTAMLAAVPQLPASTEPAPRGRRKILMPGGMIDVTPEPQTAPAEPVPSTASEDGEEAAERAFRDAQYAISQARTSEFPSPQILMTGYDLVRFRNIAALAKPSTIASAENSQDQQSGEHPPSRAEPASQHDSSELAFDKLHSDIMNLPCKMGRAIEINGASKQAYKEGHRDARHAAAELIAEFASRCRAQGGVTSEEECTLCDGFGFIDGAGSICPHCDGSGIERATATPGDAAKGGGE